MVPAGGIRAPPGTCFSFLKYIPGFEQCQDSVIWQHPSVTGQPVDLHELYLPGDQCRRVD